MSVKARKTVLLVDDEMAMVWLLTNFLRETFEVVTKADGNEALTWLKEGNMPDIVISDINMPNLDGYEFLKIIRNTEIWSKLPVIVLSANEKTSEKIRCFTMGANDYIVKPFNPVELKIRISVILGMVGN